MRGAWRTHSDSSENRPQKLPFVTRAKSGGFIDGASLDAAVEPSRLLRMRYSYLVYCILRYDASVRIVALNGTWCKNIFFWLRSKEPGASRGVAM